MPRGGRCLHGLSGDLGFSEQDRRENIRRVGHVARRGRKCMGVPPGGAPRANV